MHADVAFAEEAPPVERGKFAFFEKRIRPVLVQHCYKCHSRKSKKIRGGLLVDSRAGLRKGGESGPAVVPKNIKKSLLIGAIKHDSFEMPPSGRLPNAVIADFVKWINAGAPDPRDGKATVAKKTSIDIERGRDFWAFRPVKSPALPTVNNTNWPRTAIDRFVLNRLEQRGLTPVADADRRTLIRRLTFDLIGLPPSTAEIAAYLVDESDHAFEKLVDRLLASPHFGEHWGRHWLDVSRYADSNGGDINLTFRNAWRYRDYVIRSFNADKPFNEFVVENLAGDLIDAPKGDSAALLTQRADRLIASSFLVIGPKMLSERDKEKLRMDVVDEQIDSVGRTFLGLTLGCARCHDHKFDPISTRDYYALAGIFRSTVTVRGIRMNNVNISGWIERPLPISAARKRELVAYNSRLDDVTKQLAAVNRKLGRSKIATVVAVDSLPGIVVDDVDATLVGNWKKSVVQKRYVGAGYVHDEKMEKGRKSITFTPNLPVAGTYEVRIAYAGGNGRDRKVPIEIQSADGTKTMYVNQFPQPRIGGLFHSLGEFRFKAGRDGFVRITNKGTTEFVIADAVQFLRTDGKGAPLTKRVGPGRVDPGSIKAGAKAAIERKRTQLTRRLAAIKKQAPSPAPQCMAPADCEEPADCRLRIRGEPHNLGALVPRGFPKVFGTRGSPSIRPKQSGRLELARWVADKRNPLTPRVIVNRIWHHLFGVGIVRSVDNFGIQGDRPSHPELLDRLTQDFLNDGWSIKNAIRRIVLSHAYQLSSVHNERAMAIDPGNRMLWRHNRRRLTAESIRDAILAVSGRLNRTAGASSVSGMGEIAVANNAKDKTGTKSNTAARRSIYLALIRNDLPDLLTAFDFADPDVVVGARSATTVPAQALLMMNSAFVKTHARELATEALAQESLSDRDRLAWIYERAIGRLPRKPEIDRALAYLALTDPAVRPSTPLDAWASFCHAMLASTEFRFVE